MRVLIVAHGFPPSGRGGAELYAHAHATTLVSAGDHVRVLARESDSSRRDFDVRRETRDGVAVAWLNNTFASIRSFRDSYTDERIDAVAARVIDEFKPDVAHVHHLTCLSTTIVNELAARNVPVFCTLHDYWLLCHRGQLLDRDVQVCANPATCARCLGPEAYASPAVFKVRAAIAPALRLMPPRLTAAIRNGGRAFGRSEGREDRPGAEHDPASARRDHMRSVLQSITHFFAPSAYLRDRYISAGIHPSRISVSEYGWSLPSPSTAVQAGSVRPRTPLQVGFIGSLMVSKAPHLLIEAAARLPPGTCEVHIFGSPADYHGDRRYRTNLDRLRKPMGGSSPVTFHGPVDRDQLRATLARLDVVIVPSIWPENSPLVIREAFLAGVPVIASRIGGIPETATDGLNGLLVEPGDVADLARAIRRLIDEPTLLPQLRTGIPAVRTIEDDVKAMRTIYEAAATSNVPDPIPRRIAAVVLNYNTPDQTFLAARSLLLSHRSVDHVIVVDNSSDERCRLALTPILDRITFIATNRNLGFSGGMNAGITHALDAGADAVLLVNSDVIVPPDCVAALVRGLHDTPRAGIAGPIVVSRTSPDRIASSGIAYNTATGRMLHRDVGAPRTTRLAGGPVTVEAVSGCLMLVRREVFEKAGVFDPDFFFSFEDIDLCLRARTIGLSTIVVPDATALHEGGRSMGSDTARRFYFGARNQLRLARRHSGSTSSATAALRSLHVVALNLAHAFRASGGTLPARLTAVARGTRDYSVGRFGPDR